MKKWIYNLLIIVFSAVLLVSGVMVGLYYWDAHTQESRYQDLAELRPEINRRPEIIQDATQPTEATLPQPETVEVIDPTTGQTREILKEFAQLYEMNSDIVGWLTIPGIGVDYPVMQTPNDPEYYLRRNFDKEKNNRGCLFIHEKCDVYAPSDNVIIYGHHMRDGSMFGKLDKYTKKSFCQENPYIYFDTLTGLNTYEVMAVFLTTATVGEGFAYQRFIDAQSEEAFSEFVQQCKELALYETGVDAHYGDKLICLSTCEYSQTNGRLVVVAKKVA